MATVDKRATAATAPTSKPYRAQAGDAKRDWEVRTVVGEVRIVSVREPILTSLIRDLYLVVSIVGVAAWTLSRTEEPASIALVAQRWGLVADYPGGTRP